MRIRIGPVRRMLSLVVVGILAAAMVQGGAEPVSGQFVGPGNSQCDVPSPFVGNPFLAQIDVKPGNRGNPVNTGSHGVIEIAICSEPDPDNSGPLTPFNAPEDVYVKCNPAGPNPTSPSCRDHTGKGTPSSPLSDSSPTAGKDGDELSLHSCNSARDVNHDGLKDLVCHFYVDRMDLNSANTIILIGCCKTPEFAGANEINCEADCGFSFDPFDECEIEC